MTVPVIPRRTIGPFDVSAIGLGCMSLSHAYGTPPDPGTAAGLLRRALDLGYTHIDTAALYGFGANETLIGQALKGRRQEFVLASKCGMFRNAQGQREIDGRPETIKRTCEDSLSRLQTDVIDLYYLHRWDKRLPIEESVGALADLVQEGKVRTIGLSEVSAETLRKAHREHPVTAVQTEYSLWTRNAEVAVLDACEQLGVAFVAFSPLARGFLTGELRDVSTLPPKDIRLAMPRFQGDHFPRNLALLDGLQEIAREHGCTMAQLALAWLLAQREFIVPIPGTTRADHLEENLRALDVRLDSAAIARLDALINPDTVSGPRYNAATQTEIDTEEVQRAGPHSGMSFTPSPGWLNFHPNPSVPEFKLPRGAVDAHCHVFGPGDEFPYAPERKYTPCDASKHQLFALRDRLGFDKNVIVQATCHGTDNRALVDALQASGGRARGVATVDRRVTDAQLQAMHDAGVRGTRFNFVRRLVDFTPREVLAEIAERIAPLGWHVVIYFEAVDLPDLWDFFTSLPTTVVVDHMGRPDVRKPVDGPEFELFMRMMREHGNIWSKVSCPERLSFSGPPALDGERSAYRDVVPFARRLVDTFPDRVLWGTDWPHPNLKDHMPDDGLLVDFIPHIAATAEAQHKLLVDNPTRLYWG